MREIVCPGCAKQMLLALDDHEPLSVSTTRIESGFRIIASARGIDLPVHDCGWSDHAHDRHEQHRAWARDARSRDDSESDGAATPGEAQWAFRIMANMDGFEPAGRVLESHDHGDHHEYVILLGEASDTE
jgi:hypothetical protein